MHSARLSLSSKPLGSCSNRNKHDVGADVGDTLGLLDGESVGSFVGDVLGTMVGFLVGDAVGAVHPAHVTTQFSCTNVDVSHWSLYPMHSARLSLSSKPLGSCSNRNKHDVGADVGDTLGLLDGESVGSFVGDVLGTMVGFLVGDAVGAVHPAHVTTQFSCTNVDVSHW